MDESVTTLMTIIGPLVLLLLLIWAATRSKRKRGEASEETTERATRELYRKEEQRHDEGTEGN